MSNPEESPWSYLIPSAEKTRLETSNSVGVILVHRLEEVLSIIKTASKKGKKEVWIDREDSEIDTKIKALLKEKGYFVDTFCTRHANTMCIQWREKYEYPAC